MNHQLLFLFLNWKIKHHVWNNINRMKGSLITKTLSVRHRLRHLIAPTHPHNRTWLHRLCYLVVPAIFWALDDFTDCVTLSSTLFYKLAHSFYDCFISSRPPFVQLAYEFSDCSISTPSLSPTPPHSFIYGFIWSFFCFSHSLCTSSTMSSSSPTLPLSPARVRRLSDLVDPHLSNYNPPS